MRFEWDQSKSEANRRERGFDFAFSTLIFDGPTVESEDRRRNYGERRVVAIGLADGLQLTVVYTDRTPGGETSRRIVSARRSNRFERRIFEESTKKSDSSPKSRPC